MDSVSIVLLGGAQIVRFGLPADERRTFIAADACTTECADDEGHLDRALMASFIRNVSFDCSDPYALAQFWSAVVGHPVDPDFVPGDTEVVIEPPGGPRLFFQAVPESKTVKNRVHVCLQSGDRDRDTEVDRLLGLGAKISDDHRTSDGDGWVVLLDPAGNEFCMTCSAAERQS